MKWIRYFIGFMLFSTLNAELTLEKMQSLYQIGDVEVSPDGKQVAYIYKELENSEFKRVMCLQSLEHESKTLYENETNPRWSPDGKWLATINANQSVSVINPKTGDLRVFGEDIGLIQSFRWSPDGGSLALVAFKPQPINENAISHVISDPAPKCRLHTLSLETGECTCLTDGTFHVVGSTDFAYNPESYDWAPNGREIIFSYSPENQMNSIYTDQKLAIASLDTSTIEPFGADDNNRLPRYSPDGKWIAYLSTKKENSFTFVTDIEVRSRDGLRTLTFPQTEERGPFITGPSLIGWSQDGTSLYYFEPFHTRFRLIAINPFTQEIKEMPLSSLHYHSPRLSASGHHFGFVAEDLHTPPEGYIYEIDKAYTKKITQLNEHYKKEPIGKSEVITWKSRDGQEIEGILTYPLNYSPGNKHPLIVDVHGGPMGAFFERYLGRTYPYPTAMFSNLGAFVLRPNPRGSCGYGWKFRTANLLDWGGEDYQDIMAGVDYLILKGWVDQEKMGLCGWSYGGYMAAWSVTKTDRFALASAGAGLSNLMSMAATTDIPALMTNYFGGYFTKNLNTYLEHSPILYCDQVKTPVLIQCGSQDIRVPIGQSYEFYNALKFHNKEVKFIAYPKSAHGPADYQTEKKVMEDNLDWFAPLFSVKAP